MDRAAARRKAIEQYGPWGAYNLDLGDDVFTMAPGLVGASELSARRTLQLVDDVMGSVEGLRVLDLGTLEGLYAVELALHGATVVAVEAREANLEKARVARDAFGLENLELVHADLREIRATDLGSFDVVLCLGVLYHLDAPSVFAFVEELGRLTRRLAVVETQVGLVGRRRYRWRGRRYRGHVFAEDPRHLWAGLDPTSLWLTRASLLNLLADAGFTTVQESLMPVVPETARYRDHVVLSALKGVPAQLRAAPQVNAVPRARRPEAMRRVAHPGQSVRSAFVERLRSRIGQPLAPVFRKRAGPRARTVPDGPGGAARTASPPAGRGRRSA
jgi:hypothetical protein